MNDIWKNLPREIILYMLEWSDTIKNRRGRLMGQISKEDPRYFLYRPKAFYTMEMSPGNYTTAFMVREMFMVSISTQYDKIIILVYRNGNWNSGNRYVMH